MKPKSSPILSVSKPNDPPSPFVRRNIFLVDDHPVTRDGVRALIDQQTDLVVCGQADSAPLALQLLEKQTPDLAIIDIVLKTTSGIELMKNLKSLLPALPVLIMSMHDESLYAERALRSGAKGYIMKHEASERILTAIRMILNGDVYLSEKMKEHMLHRLARNRKNEVVFTIDTLSNREMEVFHLIGNGFGTHQIADKLNLSIKTIDSYREHLKLKLQLKKGSDLVQHAIQWVRAESIV